jgi:hypothetical protein
MLIFCTGRPNGRSWDKLAKDKESRKMGTRADFFIGTGEEAEWLGSVAFDGYEWDEEPGNELATAKTEAEFREAVANILSNRNDATMPEQGWPWPWETSELTDFTYYFEDGVVRWDQRRDWPAMDASNVAIPGTPRSGLGVWPPLFGLGQTAVPDTRNTHKEGESDGK